MSDFDFEYRPPLKPEHSIQARTKHGSFSKSWWGNKWIASLKRLQDSGRLRRGASYARSGQVMSIAEGPAGITAQVQGSRPTPYTISISLDPLTPGQWDEVIEVMSQNALFAAELLAGEMPADIEEAFREAGVSLFPARPDDIHTSCSCPDWADVCKHIAATAYLLAERFDQDPFMLFRLRGRDQREILEALHRLRNQMETRDDVSESSRPRSPYTSADEQTLQGAPQSRQGSSPTNAGLSGERLNMEIETFWEGAGHEAPLAFNLHPPEIEMALLKQLGPPDFTTGDLAGSLAPIYRALTAAGLSIVVGAHSDNTSSNP